MAVVVASALADGGTAIALDDGTVWLVRDGDADELGDCDDGDVVSLGDDDGALAIECGDGSRWIWDDGGGWQERATDAATEEPGDGLRSYWPALDIAVDRDERARKWESWIRLRWDL
jgi:hypothetical protein